MSFPRKRESKEIRQLYIFIDPRLRRDDTYFTGGFKNDDEVIEYSIFYFHLTYFN
jgi:hypothetical protein